MLPQNNFLNAVAIVNKKPSVCVTLGISKLHRGVMGELRIGANRFLGSSYTNSI